MSEKYNYEALGINWRFAYILLGFVLGALFTNFGVNTEVQKQNEILWKVMGHLSSVYTEQVHKEKFHGL